MPQAAAERQTDYEDLTKVKDLFDRCMANAKGNSVRLDRDKQDIQNLMFHRGGPDNHWTAWDENANTWRTVPNDGEDAIPAWVPRCSTNVFAKCIDGINSILNQSAPALQWKPATDDDADRAAADVADDATPVLLEEIDYPHNLKRKINSLVTLVDKVAVFYYYDTDEKYGTSEIGLLRCPDCGVETTPMDVQDAGEACPECGQQEEMQPVIDEFGKPRGVPYPKGKICARAVSNLEFSVPSSARSTDVKQMPWVLFHNREDKHECLRLWPKASTFIEDASRDAKWSPQQRAFADQMTRLSSPRAAARAGSGTDMKDAGPVVYRLVHDPVVDSEFNFPDGLMAVQIGNEVVEAGPLPVLDDDERPIKPVLIRTFQEGAGSCYGKPPADDLVPLQRQRNIIETLLVMILLHNAAPRTFIPLSVQLEDDISGIPGQDVRYRTTIPGEKPTTEPGRNPPEGLYKFLEMIDAKFDELSKLNAVLQGERPDGDPTLGEIQRLEEHGQAQFKTPLDNLVEFELNQARMLLYIARRSAWSPRFLQVKGENGGWDVQQFYAANLQGRIDVFCEHASAWPRSPLSQQLKLRTAVELGVLNPALDPELQDKVLGLLDLTEFKQSLDVDRKQIGRELDRWKQAQTPQEITPPKPFDTIPLHLHLKSQWMKTEEAEALIESNPMVYQAMVAHIQMLQQMLYAQQMQATQVQSGKPPQQEKPDDRTEVERGKQDTLHNAVQSGAIRPQGAGGDPLKKAVGSGVLVPAAGAQAQRNASAPSLDRMVKSGVVKPAQPGRVM